MRKIFTAIAALAALSGSAGAANAARAYIGTYTPDPRHGATIMARASIWWISMMPPARRRNPRLVAKQLSPSWITLSPDDNFLYANSEILDYGPDKTGSVTAYAVDKASGALKPLNTVSSGSAGPAYIAAHPSGKFVLVANYAGGSFAVIRVKPDGSLGEISDLVKPDGPLNPSSAADTQPGQFAGSDHGGSHGHMIGPIPRAIM